MASVCELTRAEVNELQQHGVKPDCRQHRHIRRIDAIEAHNQGAFTFIAYRAGYNNAQYTWAKKYRRTGLCHLLKGPGEPGMQLVRGAR